MTRVDPLAREERMAITAPPTWLLGMSISMRSPGSMFTKEIMERT
ncbi:MAG: hypothetical protein WHT46_09865 [Candidatus Geothermincolales bacterium]